MNLIFLGPPGGGKGTASQRLIDELGIIQISTGDLLRGAVKEGSELGKKAKGYMDAGELVPDQLVIDMLNERVKKDDCRNGFILDGFPRTIPQAEALDETDIKIDHVINFDVDDSIIVHRLSGRRIHKETGKIYNVNEGGIPPVPEDMSEDELLQRDDDKPEAILNRLEVYHEQTEPLFDYYRKKDMLVNIDANRDLGPICDDIKQAIGAV